MPGSNKSKAKKHAAKRLHLENQKRKAENKRRKREANKESSERNES